MKIEKLKDKSILILGYGKEGNDVLKFLTKIFPTKVFGVADLNEKIKVNSKKIKLYLGKDYLSAIDDYDIVIKSPGIKLAKSKKIITGSQIFFDNFKGTIIGVTGTKGKSTTSSLIHDLLSNAKYNVSLLGNIGKSSLLSVLISKEEDFCVYELSSHQLYYSKLRPSVAVILNIYPEHLDYYKDFKTYRSAKLNITKYQKKEDYLITNLDIKTKAKILKYNPIKNDKVHPDNLGVLCVIAKLFKIKDEILQKTFKEYQNLEHRLEHVGTFNRIDFYNDSLATIPQATEYAIDSLGSKLDTLIAGGFNRGVDYSSLVDKIISSNIKTLILFPGSGDKIYDILQKKEYHEIEIYRAKNMKQAVKLCFKHGKDICLLSCAASSFGLFKDYKDRGNQFKKYIKSYE